MKRALALSLAVLCVVPAAADARKAKAKKVKAASVAVTFTVRNTNTSQFACASDGGTYQIKGHITGPASALAAAKRKQKKRPRGVTLYLHGLGVAEWLWYFEGVPSYNYALQQARAGHVSVTVDRLGYGASSRPDGNQICIGSEADIAHQIVQALKTGSYTVAAGKPRRYRRVALAGHSASGETAILEAYSYGDINALVVVAFSFSNLPVANTTFGNQRNQCQGGQTVAPGYAFFGQPGAEFERTFFHSATAAVRRLAVPLHPADPCGVNLSLIDAINRQRTGTPKIKVPALVVCGANDTLYAPFACQPQAERFGSKDKRSIIIRNAGHGLPLEKPAAKFRSRLGAWLARRGF